MTRLLLLEDDPILHEIIAEYLEEHGYEVDGYFDGEQALQAIMDGGHAMLILDVRVPELDGFELLEYLRDIRNTTPAIFITSLSGIKDLQKGFRLGANDYLKKPFELDELRIRIEHQLTATRHKVWPLSLLPAAAMPLPRRVQTYPPPQRSADPPLFCPSGGAGDPL